MVTKMPHFPLYLFQLSNLEFRDLCEVYARICDTNEGIFAYDFRAPANLSDWHQRKRIQREVFGQSVTAHAVCKGVFS